MKEFAVGLQSLKQELSAQSLVCGGQVPSWLRGTLLRNGPALFEAGNSKLQHWFDGYAMLHRFLIHDQTVTYNNRFIASDAYRAATSQQRVVFSEFATDPARNWIGRLQELIHPQLTDNTNVNLGKWGNRYFAATETPALMEFDPLSLNTLGKFKFDDTINGQITTAHPLYDFKQQALYNFTVTIGPHCSYQIYRLKKDEFTRELIAKISIDAPAYMHSFAMTERYIILIESPLRLKVWPFIICRKPYIENYAWNPEQGIRFHVIEKATGDIVGQFEGEAAFFFHQLNAYEHGSELFIDIPIFPDANIIQNLYLNHIAVDAVPAPRPVRYRLNLTTTRLSHEPLAECNIELPRIYERLYQSQPYKFVYGVNAHKQGDFLDRLIKIDIRSGDYQVWSDPHCYPGEPVFIPNPTAVSEDDGVVLSVVLDTQAQHSFLLFLESQTFEEIARAKIPQMIPFGFHGQFFAG